MTLWTDNFHTELVLYSLRPVPSQERMLCNQNVKRRRVTRQDSCVERDCTEWDSSVLTNKYEVNYDRCLRYHEQLGEHKKKEWHCFSWWKTKSQQKRLAGQSRGKCILQIAHRSSRILIAMEDSRAQKFTGTQKAVKWINQYTSSWSRNLFDSEISKSYHWESTLLSVPMGPWFYTFLGTSSSVLQDPLGLCLLSWKSLCVLNYVLHFFRHHLYPHSLRLCNHRIIEWLVGRDLRGHPVPITQSDMLWRPLHGTAQNKGCKLLRADLKFWWAINSRRLKLWWSPGRMTSVNLAVWLKQTHTKIWNFSKINFLHPGDMAVLQASTPCCISFPTPK